MSHQSGTSAARASSRVATFVRVVNRPVATSETAAAVAEFLAIRFPHQMSTYHQTAENDSSVHSRHADSIFYIWCMANNYPQTQARMCARARAQAHAYAHTRTHARTHARTHTRAHARTDACTRARTRTRASPTHTRTPARTHARTCIEDSCDDGGVVVG